jgi:flagellum-specific peptidoglycan hydrolase FlgJ
MATIDVGRVGLGGGIDDAQAPERPVAPKPDAVFERQLVAARTQTAARTAAQSTKTNRTIAATTTHLSGSEAAASLSAAYQNVFHEPPSPATLRVLVAQWSHETGGGRAMMNFNFGGIKGSSPSGLSAAYRTTEGEGQAAIKITDRFRAYGSAIEGATDYVKFLSSRFTGAMTEARQGNAEGFVRALKHGGYFTGSEEDYVRSVTRLTEQARTNGFDSVGRAPGTTHALAHAALPAAALHAPHDVRDGAVRSVGVPSLADVADVADSKDPAAQVQAYYAADALAMADELCRAAMRIATDDERKGS